MRGHPRFPGFPSPDGARRTRFQALARAIVFQQLAYPAADTIHRRVCALTPGPAFPTSRRLLALAESGLRSAGLSKGKLRAIRDLAERVEDGRLRLAGLHYRTDGEVVEALTQVFGIGEWTAQMFLIFHLGRLDVLPSGDLGIQNGLQVLDGLKDRPTPRYVEERGQQWAPLRTVASWYLYRLADAR